MWLTRSRTNDNDRRATHSSACAREALGVGGCRVGQFFLSEGEGGSLDCATVPWLGFSVEPSWAGLDGLPGSTSQVSSGTRRAEDRFLPFLEIEPSGKFFLKAAIAVPKLLFHHGRLQPQRWVRRRVRLVGAQTSPLLVGFCSLSGKGLVSPVAIAQSACGQRSDEACRLVTA